MSSIHTEKSVAPAGPLLGAEQQHLICWQSLQPDEQAFVVAYIENSYSLPLACEALRKNRGEGSRLLKSSKVKGAIAEVQQTLQGIDFLNEKWVQAQLLRLFPMVMGDECAPTVTNTGEEIEVRMFKPDIAMRIIEYVAPKASKQTVNINVNNVHKLTDAQLEELAARGMGRVVSEQ